MLLELAILGLLKEQELHGYELKKRLGETLGPFSCASFGSLYPALRRLESAGAVSVVHEAGGVAPTRPVPMTGSLGGELAAFANRTLSSTARKGGRTRKVYAITPGGEQLFDELLSAGPDGSADDRAFNLKLAFAGHLRPEARLGLLERRRAFLVQKLAGARSGARARRDRLDSYTRSLVEHTREATEHDISWLDRLIESEKGTVK